jgi:predicted nucleic acid-binding protein
MGLLRLLTNTRVMGADALSEESAWRVFFELAKDSRVTFAEEPEGIEWEWKRLTSRRTAGASRWTDAYLQAFAGLREMRVLTFDRGFLAWPEPPAQILS